MRYIGLDLGSKTLGVALSDTTGLIASSYTIIRHNEDYDSLIDEIEKIIDEKKVDEIVLGLPKNMNNTLGEKANLSIKFKGMLEQRLAKKVHLIDERLTTVEATNILLLNDTSRKKRKKVIDSVAASIILQTFLDRERNK
ncbi:MAG: Holliday junction resolvase RuvX [bacterium]|nr:Holliday junction resolvase RuvX [bacterium]